MIIPTLARTTQMVMANFITGEYRLALESEVLGSYWTGDDSKLLRPVNAPRPGKNK